MKPTCCNSRCGISQDWPAMCGEHGRAGKELCKHSLIEIAGPCQGGLVGNFFRRCRALNGLTIYQPARDVFISGH